VAVVEEGDEGVDVSAAAAATRDDLILNNGNRVLIVMERAVRLDNERKRQLGFLEQRIGRRYGVERRANVSRRAIGIGRRRNARL